MYCTCGTLSVSIILKLYMCLVGKFLWFIYQFLPINFFDVHYIYILCSMSNCEIAVILIQLFKLIGEY